MPQELLALTLPITTLFLPASELFIMEDSPLAFFLCLGPVLQNLLLLVIMFELRFKLVGELIKC